MEFRISDTFTQSLAKLTGEEQKAVKTTAFDLQMNPENPGMSFHKLDRARDKNFWSVRVNSDIRLIVHRTEGSLLLCYVSHHDQAYDWATRRKLETHPKTGAAQLVEIRETVQEIMVPTYVKAPRPAAHKRLFDGVVDDDLLGYGVPKEWLADVRTATEETLLGLTDHLPGEAAEALLELATGGKPLLPQPVAAIANPFDHPDAQRRFRVMSNAIELERALEYPWDKWTIFLHPAQRQWVERDHNGPARVSGSAGTGKTIVALHRAAHLARTNANALVLLTTFSDVLANELDSRMRRLTYHEPRLMERIEVTSIEEAGKRLYRPRVGIPNLIGPERIAELLRNASEEIGGHRFTLQFLQMEWDQIVDAWQLKTWEEYRDVARLGRKTRLPEAQRAVLWSIFERVLNALAAQKQLTQATMFTQLAELIPRSNHPPFDFAVVDEAQDITVAHLRFLAALGAHRPDSLFFSGDLGQRIFQQPFSWKSLGVDVRGRSRTLRVNYRTSHQIRSQADKLLDREVSDFDGNKEERWSTVSVFNGPLPEVRTFRSMDDERTAVCEWIAKLQAEGVQPHEIAVFVRSESELSRVREVLSTLGASERLIEVRPSATEGRITIGTMHLAKGLEFRAVAVMACDGNVIPLQERIELIGDSADLQDVLNTERQLLYVACTRARDFLLVTGTKPASEFLDDLGTVQ